MYTLLISIQTRSHWSTSAGKLLYAAEADLHNPFLRPCILVSSGATVKGYSRALYEAEVRGSTSVPDVE